MKKIGKALLTLLLLLVLAAAALVVKALIDARRQAEDQARMPKTDEVLLSQFPMYVSASRAMASCSGDLLA